MARKKFKPYKRILNADGDLSDPYGLFTDSSGNTGAWGDLSGDSSDLSGDYSVLDPFSGVMSDAVSSAGVTPPKTTSALSNVFNSLFSSGENTGSTVGNIVNYFSRQLVSPQPSNPQVAQGVQRVISQPSNSVFSSPFLWVGIIALIGLVIWLVKR